MKKQFRNFEDARIFTQKLDLKSQLDWNEYRKSQKKPPDIPTDPAKTYKNNGWVNWRDWLGTKDLYTFEKKHRSFEDARKFVHVLKLKNVDEWYAYCKSNKKPKDILSEPRGYPKFKGFGDWLGTKRIGNYKKQGISWKEAKPIYKKIVKENNIRYPNQWAKYILKNKLPEGLPPRPNEAYEEFKGYADCFGFEQRFLNFETARTFVQSLNLKSKNEWTAFLKSNKKPENIPNNPSQVYKDWKGWADWLGTGNLSGLQLSEKQLPWPQAKLEYQKLKKIHNLRSESDWIKFIKTHDLPKGLPKYPESAYSKSKIVRRISRDAK